MSQKNKITIEDYIKANKIANREIEIKQGFIVSNFIVNYRN